MDENKDVLSQEEIDALLKGSSGGEEQAEVEEQQQDEHLSDLEKDAIGEIGNISMGTAATTLSVLLNYKVEITTPKVSITDHAALRENFPKPHVAVEVEYTEGLQGVNVLIIKTEDAKVIANLMMGGDGTDIYEGELEDFHLSAVGEAMNQMMGSTSTSLSEMFSYTINISPPNVKMIDLSETKSQEELPNAPMAKVSFNLKVGDLIDSEIMQLVPLDFAKDMVRRMTGESEKSQATEESEQHPKQEQTPPQKQEQETFSDKHQQSESNPQGPKKDYQPVEFSPLTSPAQPDKSGSDNLELIMDVPLEMSVELGRTNKMIKEILELVPGSIVELDKVAGEPVDIKVNGKMIAKGEVVVIDENFGIRITDIVSPMERVNKLQ